MKSMKERHLVIVLAGGYGTRLQSGLASEPEYASLVGCNKALLPLEKMGGVLLDCWMRDMDAAAEVVVATNQAHLPQFHAWCERTGFPRERVFCDGTTSNDNRLGAVATLKAALDFAAALLADTGLPSRVAVIPADTIIKGQYHVITTMLQRLISSNQSMTSSTTSSITTSITTSTTSISTSTTSTTSTAPSTTMANQRVFGVLLAYEEQEHCLPMRGIVELSDDDETVVRFLEKPRPSDTASRLAAPAVFVFADAQRLVALLGAFLAARSAPAYTIDDRDSPGRFVAWLVNEQRERLLVQRIVGRYDVGNVSDYRLCTGAVYDVAFARLGLMGNPSDSCQGCAIAVSIQNFAAVVNLTPTFSPRVRLQPHRQLDHLDIPDVQHMTRLFNGGIRLVKAAIFVFVRFCRNQGIPIHDRGFELTYDTSIPRQLGLAGSSALVCAVFKCLQRWYNVTLPSYHAPLLLLSVELSELNITAGLMDRVIQWHEGLLFLDFSGDYVGPALPVADDSLQQCGAYQMERLDRLLPQLPSLVLYYSTDEASESGAVHSTVRKRYYDGDAEIRAGMQALADKARAGRQALIDGDRDRFARLMQENFELRYAMYGVEKIGAKNLAAVRQLQAAGYAGKFPGSGGAIVAAPLDHAAARPAPDIDGYTKVTPIAFLPATHC